MIEDGALVAPFSYLALYEALHGLVNCALAPDVA